ncbi:hypothetical protein [Hoeflea sp.]|uniref:hypothetical protein n=1 Tax=Hoeflea sp. TaxID=1940281 RepID=UPI003B017000
MLLMLTGGLDSVALLANLLSATKCRVHAHHIDLHNFERRGDAEADAIAKVLPYCWEHYRDFEYTSSKFVFHIGTCGYDITLVMFMAARLLAVMPEKFDYVVTGHRHPDTPLEEFTEASAVYNAGLTNLPYRPAWLKPLSGVDKKATFRSIPEELAMMSWSCRQPVYDDDDAYHACGKCHACIALENVRAVDL